MHGPPARGFSLSIPLTLIASVAAVSVLGWLVNPLQRAFLLIPSRVRERWEIHRLLTAGWVHKDISHLAFNMLSLYFFADEALQVLGVAAFLALYVSAVVVAFVPTTLRHSRDPKYASLGASGAVTAVMFSAILLHPNIKLQVIFLPMPIPGLVYAAGYLVYSIWRSYRAGDGINHEAHLSGAFYGALFTYVFEPAKVERALRSLG